MESIIIFVILSTLINLSLILCTCCFYRQYMKLKKQNALHEINTTVKKNETNKNPLGTLLNPSTKSYTLYLDSHACITFVNEAFLEITGYQKKELIGKNIYGTLIDVPSKKEPFETRIIKRIFDNPKLYTEHETELIAKNGKKIWITWTNKIIYDQKNHPVELHSVGFDITKRKELETELRFLASTDPQTGVLNRQSLLETGTTELKRSLRYKHHFSVLVLKLYLTNTEKADPKKEDILLQQVVTLCRRSIRDVDYLGRISDVDFAILLPETSLENVKFVQERIQEKIIAYNQKNTIKISAQFGSAEYIKTDLSLDDIIMRANRSITKIKKGKK